MNVHLYMVFIDIDLMMVVIMISLYIFDIPTTSRELVSRQ